LVEAKYFILNRKLDKLDIGFILDKILVYEDHIDVYLKSDIDALLKCRQTGLGPVSIDPKSDEIMDEITHIIQKATNHTDKIYHVNVISDGDPLEIYTERDGEVIFKKYSPMGDLTELAGQICESISKNTGHIAVVCDRDCVIAVSGASKRDLMDKRNSADLEQLMEQRRTYRYQAGESKIRVSDTVDRYHLGVATPILSEGDLMGCVMILLEENDQALSEPEQKLVQTVAGFLGRQMEN